MITGRILFQTKPAIICAITAYWPESLIQIICTALVTNCDDLQKWYECLRKREILSEHAYEIYLSENRNHYCYGLERYDDGGIIKYAHGGDYLGVSAYTQYYFEEALCIIIISNTESLDQYRFGNGIAAIMHNGQAPVSDEPKEVYCRQRTLKNTPAPIFPARYILNKKR